LSKSTCTPCITSIISSPFCNPKRRPLGTRFSPKTKGPLSDYASAGRILASYLTSLSAHLHRHAVCVVMMMMMPVRK
jgi:hypothetical protein